MKHYRSYPLLKHNTFGIDVRCADYYEYETKDELRQLHAKGALQKFLCIGEGSNLLLLNDIDYSVLHSAMKKIEIADETDKNVWVRVGSGYVWDEFVEWTIEHQLGGVENLSFIPGMVGASPVQNIGAYGVEAKDVIAEVEVYDAREDRFFVLNNAQCAFEYRGSIFKGNVQWVVVSVVFKLEKLAAHTFRIDYGNIKAVLGEKEVTLKNIREVIVKIRKEKLPIPSEIGSAGSFFKNPVVSEEKYREISESYEGLPFFKVENGYKIPAAWLISQCGWKGKNVGHVGVYEKQPLILVNRGGATGEEVLDLMRLLQKSVEEKFKIDLHPEVCIVK